MVRGGRGVLVTAIGAGLATITFGVALNVTGTVLVTVTFGVFTALTLETLVAGAPIATP